MTQILTIEPLKTVYKVTIGQSIWIANLCAKNYCLARSKDIRLIFMAEIFCEKPVCSSQLKKKQLIFQPTAEDVNVITALKCNKLLSVITFGLKCNNVIPTSSVTLLTCCWLLVASSVTIKKVSEHVFSGLSRD